MIVNVEEIINITGSEDDNGTEELTKVGTKYLELKQQVQNWQKAIKNFEPGYKMRRADKLFEQIRNDKIEIRQNIINLLRAFPSVKMRQAGEGSVRSVNFIPYQLFFFPFLIYILLRTYLR